MKKWFILLGVPVLLVIAVVALAVANLSRFVNENREWIGEQARSTVGRGIDFGEVGISLWGGLAVRVEGLAVEDDPAFSQEAFVSADAIEVEVAFLPALRGEIQVDRIVLRSPTITVIQTARGLNIDSLGAADAAPPEPTPEPESPGGLPAFLIAFVDISDGTLRYVDRTLKPPSETRIEQLDFRAADIRAEGPIDFELAAAVLESSEQNVHVSGRVTDLANPVLDLEVTSSALDPTPVPGQAPENLLEDLEIAAKLSLADGAPKVNGQLRSPRGILAGAPYTDLAVDFGLRDHVARLDKLGFESFGGRVQLSGRYDMRVPDDPGFDLAANVSALSVAEVLRHQAPSAPPHLKGALGLDLSLQGRGSGWDAIKRTLRGKGALELADGVLEDVNLVETALASASGVPGLSNLLPPELREEFPAVFGVGDTVFEKLEGTLQLKDGWASFRELRFGASDYEVRGRGRVSLDGEVEVGTTLALSRALSDALVEQASAVQYLRAKDGRVELPVRLGGSLPNIEVAPDVDLIAKAATRQAAGRLLDEVLGGKSQTGEGDSEQAGEEGAAKPAPRPEDVLRRAVGDLFGN